MRTSRTGLNAQHAHSLSQLLTAAVPLETALGMLAAAAAHQEKAHLEKLRARITAGRSLREALEDGGEKDAAIMAIVEAGEHSGKLPALLQDYAGALQEQARLRGQILQALIGPGFVLLASMATLALLLGIVLPRFADMFTQMQRTLPPATAALLDFAHTLPELVLVLLILVLSAGLALSVIKRQPGGEEKIARAQLAIPFWGDILHLRAGVSVAAQLALLLPAGLTLPDALKLSAQSLRNAALRAELERAQQKIRDGQDATAALRATSLPASLKELAALGLGSGKLAPMLRTAATLCQDALNTRLTVFRQILTPALTLLLALLVAGIMLALYTALAELYDTNAF